MYIFHILSSRAHHTHNDEAVFVHLFVVDVIILTGRKNEGKKWKGTRTHASLVSQYTFHSGLSVQIN